MFTRLNKGIFSKVIFVKYIFYAKIIEHYKDV